MGEIVESLRIEWEAQVRKTVHEKKMSLQEQCYGEFNQEDYDDITPMSIETGLKDELCQIMYTDEYKQLMGWIRTLLSENELTSRAMRLTSKVIDLAPAFYTVWNFRYNILSHLLVNSGNDANKDGWVAQELDWLDEITLNNPKNYQIWSYRQSLLTNLITKPSLKHEVPIMNMMLDDDSKNYHVWSYRKWVVKYIGDYSHELEFINGLIQRDIYNNSAWSHRMFYLKNIDPDHTVIDEEINYVKDKITLVPQNISSWNYLRGIYQIFKANQFDDDIINFTKQFTSNLIRDRPVQEKLPEIQSSYSLEFLAYIYSIRADKDTAQYLYNCLAYKYDPIRSYYWTHKIELL